jgi:hypothetical protein
MGIIICFRHLKCICRKWWRGMDYSWHVQHLLRGHRRGPPVIARRQQRPACVAAHPSTNQHALMTIRRLFTRGPMFSRPGGREVDERKKLTLHGTRLVI